MSEIESELKQLLKEREEAATVVTESQVALSHAKACHTEKIRRLAPLQQLANDLNASNSALEQQRPAAESEAKKAEKVYEEIFPIVEKEVSEEKRKALEAIEMAIGTLDQRIGELRSEIVRASEADKIAQSEVVVTNTRVRKLSSQLLGLPNQIQATRQRLSALLAGAQTAYGSGQIGEAFLRLRELRAHMIELSKLADPKTEEELSDQVGKAWEEMKAARLTAAGKSEAMAKLQSDLIPVEAELALKRREAGDARVALAGEKRAVTNAGLTAKDPTPARRLISAIKS